MTCVVALIEDGKVYMGADSLGVGGYSCITRADEKLFHNGDWLIGGTTSYRMLDLLRYKFTPPVLDPKITDMRQYMCTLFIDEVRSCLGAGGFRKKEHEVEEGGTFLVATGDELFQIHGDFQVEQHVLNYSACGCGEDLALGSLFSTEGDAPKVRIKTALEAAENFSAGVRRPFHILSTKV